MAKILVAEDDVAVADAVADSLTHVNHTVETVTDGKEAFDRLKLYEYDLAILDWNMPTMTGLEVCKEYRAQGGLVPILMLTGKGSVPNKVEGFDAGADDYLTKPFDFKELVVRVRALLRRPKETSGDILQLGSIVVDTKACKALRDGVDLNLLPKELNLLEFLMRNRNQLFSVDDLLNHLWSSESDSSEDAVRQCVTRLRRKLDVPGQESIITTVKGFGYKIEDAPK